MAFNLSVGSIHYWILTSCDFGSLAVVYLHNCGRGSTYRLKSISDKKLSEEHHMAHEWCQRKIFQIIIIGTFSRGGI